MDSSINISGTPTSSLSKSIQTRPITQLISFPEHWRQQFLAYVMELLLYYYISTKGQSNQEHQQHCVASLKRKKATLNSEQPYKYVVED